ncbi:MAG: N-acetylmuramoyl-L-alanine amidase [Planctomycetota bacterium]
MSPFVSELGNISLHDSGWVRLPSGVEISKMAAWDTVEQLFARRGWRGAQEWAEARGYRLPTVSEHRELHRIALYISPFTMPTVDMIHAAGINPANTSAVNDYRNANMSSRAWCAIHDGAVLDLLVTKGHIDEPVFNDGKHWAAEGYIFGWALAHGQMIQGPSLAHLTHEHTDYGTTFHVVRDIDGVEEVREIDTNPPEAPPDSGRRTLRLTSPYMQGHDVRELQEAIGAVVDGSFGPHTKALVVGFQKERLLYPDGIVGLKTWGAIGAVADPYDDPTPPDPGLILDLSGISFRQARHFKEGRRVEIAGITLHTAEISERTNSAEALQAYAATMEDNRLASWHYSTDIDSIAQSVRVTDVAFAAGPGNDSDIHIEISGRAGQGKVGWADDYSQSTLALTAKLCASLIHQHPQIPIVKNSMEGLLAGARGLRGHVDWSLASAEARKRGLKRTPWWSRSRNRWRSTNHTDPGPTFDWAGFLVRVRGHLS